MQTAIIFEANGVLYNMNTALSFPSSGGVAGEA